jgi:hypothetical protein
MERPGTFDALAAKYAAGQSFADGHLIKFIRQIHAAAAASPDVELTPKWTSSIEEAMSPADLERLRKKFVLDGQLVHVRAPLSLTRKNGATDRAVFDLFLLQAPEGIRSESLFVRSSITVPDEARYFRARQTFGAVIARDPVITSFLGDAENPAHTKWNGAAEKLAKNWRAGKARLSEIRNSLNRLHQALAQAVEVREPDALRDYFSIKDATGKTGPRPPVPPPPPVPPVPKKPALFSIAARRGGFAIRRGPGLTEDKLPLELRVRTAYDVFRGNPFKRFDPLDFNIAELSTSTRGLTMTHVSANVLDLQVTDVDFELQVDGYDPRRDVVVDARQR